MNEKEENLNNEFVKEVNENLGLDRVGNNKEVSKMEYTRADELKLIKLKIAKLQKDLINKENEQVKPRFHEGKNIAELQRMGELRNIRRNLKEKITTLEVINKANELINGVKE